MSAQPQELEMTLGSVAEHLDVPKNYKVEIVEGSIVVSPSPIDRHAKIVAMLHRAVLAAVTPELVVLQWFCIEVAELGDRYIPDLLVLPLTVLDGQGWNGPAWLRSASDAVLTVEVTSKSNPTVDRVHKLRGYAVAGVPHYLLVDALRRTVTLYSSPVGESYASNVRVPFGASLHLPEPFDTDLDTSLFG